MPDFALLVSGILRHAGHVNSDCEVVTAAPGGPRRASFGEVAAEATRLASGLRGLGVWMGDRVATLMWNHRAHLAAYHAVPGMGSVLHTLNHRLAADHLVHIINQAEDVAILVDESLLPVLAPVLPRTPTVRYVVVAGAAVLPELPGVEVVGYADLLASGYPDYTWPELDERSAAVMCHTSGTTGAPKGVVYSHRSIYLHSLAACTGNVFGLNDQDRVLAMVPMFHVNAWGLPYACFLAGADLLLPDRHTRPGQLLELVQAERPTLTGAVPTVLNSLLDAADAASADLSGLRLVFSGGSALPESTVRRFAEQHGVPVVQGWGMTETSPLLTMARPAPAGSAAGVGRVAAGAEVRVVGPDGVCLPRDGVAVGELEVRGAWVTTGYYRVDAPEKFRDGWLRTGDAGTISPHGVVTITDRLKDMIKSGGEWISSIGLENAIASHPAVAEAAVVGVAHPVWQERPLACVVLKPGHTATRQQLEEHLNSRVARWWIPDEWCLLGDIPKTTVGKYDKKSIRATCTRQQP